MADDSTRSLLVKISATTELLKSQMSQAAQSVEQFQSKTDGSLKRVDGAFARTEAASGRFAKQMAQLKTGFAGVTDNLTGGLQSAASQVPILGSSLSGLSGIALGTAAGFGLLATALVQGIRDTDAYEESIRSLGAVLDATGNKTGYTKAQLANFAEELESSFAISAETILKAEQVLSSFDGVAGTTFKRAIKDAADMSAVFGGDLTDNTQKVGAALQNLAEGNVEGLSRGFKFLGTATLEAIEHLAKVGDTAGAQELLLKSLEARLGGAATAKAAGLSGAFFRFTDSIADATRSMIQQIGIIPVLIRGLDNLSNAMGGGPAKSPSAAASDAGLGAARARASVNQIKAEPRAGNAQYRADTNYNARLAAAQRLLAVREASTAQAIAGARAETSTFEAEAKASADAVKAAGALAKSLGTGAGGKGAKSGRAAAVHEVKAAVDDLAGVLPATMKMLDALTKGNTAGLTSGALGDQKQDAENSDNVHQQRLYEIDEAKQKTLDAIAEQKRKADDAVRSTADLYQTLFRDGTKGLWDSFEQMGLKVVSNVAAKLTLALLSGKSAGSLGGLFDGAFKSVLGGAFAGGGSPPVGKVSLVGERGPELIVPRSPSLVIPNHMLGGGGQQSVRVQVELTDTTGMFITRVTQVAAPLAQAGGVAGHQMTMTALAKSAGRRLA